MGLTRIMGAVPPRTRAVAFGLAATQIALVAVHLIAFELTGDAVDPRAERKPFDFNQEGSIQTWWSMAVLIAAGVCVIHAGRDRKGGGIADRFAWAILGCGFLWLGFEEGILHAHEDAQVASGFDWPILYLPGLALGAWAVLRVARAIERPHGLVLIAALGMLAAAVGTEILSSPRIALDYDWRNLVEENLELAGATLVIVAALGSRPPALSSGFVYLARDPRSDAG